MSPRVSAAVAIILSIMILSVLGVAAFFHVAASPANVTVSTTPAQVSVAVSDPAGVRSVEFYERDPSVNPAATRRLDLKAFSCPASVGLGPYPRRSSISQYLVVTDNCLSASGGPGGDITFQRFNADGTPSGGVHTMTPRQYGPGPGTLQIHEYNDVNAEAAAFEAGTLDLMDFPPPSSYISSWTSQGGIVETGKAGLSKALQFGMWQVDINNWNYPTNDRSLRQALGYLIDRQRVINSFLEGLALPNCAGAGPHQPGTLSCSQLGYPTAYGDFNPAKALQVLNENGWLDANSNGILEAPNGTEPVLTFYVRADNAIQRQTGDLLTNALQNLPPSYTSTAGGTVTVCASTPVCKIGVDEKVLPRFLTSPIVFRSTGVTKWNLYTGGWAEGAVQILYYLYGSGFAWTTCGGGWPVGSGAVNYPCYVDPNFDNIARPLNEGPTYEDVLNAGVVAQRYLWGYANGKITGTMPTIPLYSRQHYAAFYLSDMGPNAIINPDGSHACWKGWVGQEQGSGLGLIPASTTAVFGYNCQEQKPGYVSYKGQGVFDWGFQTQIQQLNPVLSEWFWDQLAMQQVYDSCLASAPVNPQEIVPSMCQSHGETQVFNTALNSQTTVAVYKFQDGLRWSDGQYATAQDFKFTVEYTLKNGGYYSGFLYDIVRIDATEADASNGIGGTALVYFDTASPFLGQYVGIIPVIPQHIWCPDYNPTIGNDVGYGFQPRPGCPYPTPDLFPDFDFTKQVGTGPMIITGCQPVGVCTDIITEQPNPYYSRGTSFWNVASDVQLQPDVNRDDQVNQEDLDILQQLADFGVQSHPMLDVDYRTERDNENTSFISQVTTEPWISAGTVAPAVGAALSTDTKIKIVDSNFNGVWNTGEPVVYDTNNNDLYGPGEPVIAGPAPIILGTRLASDSRIKFVDSSTNGVWDAGESVVYDTNNNNTLDLTGAPLTIAEEGPHVSNTDLYIVQHFIYEGQRQGLPAGITWPPGRTMTYNWPDTNRDNAVDLDDLLSVYLHQFQNPVSPIGEVAMNDVNYDGSIDLGDLIIAFTRQFTKPAGVP